MDQMKFLEICLLSQNERRAFKLSFGEKPTVIRGPNGFGKSALLKSLYDTFGATPHKIDTHWKGARVYSFVKFQIGTAVYKALKTGDLYALFDPDDNLIIRTHEIGSKLTPALAKIFNFRLVANNKEGRAIIPPPPYIFAPFYIDQDKSWTSAWSGFTRMYLTGSAKLLSDYHSGSKPNEFYDAQAERDARKSELSKLLDERGVAHKTLSFVKSMSGDIELDYDLDSYASDIESLVKLSQQLGQKQIQIRDRMGRLANEREIWREQASVLRGAIAESKTALAIAVRQPEHINCPTCGHEYENSISEQFGLVEDHDGMLKSLFVAEENQRKIDDSVNRFALDLVQVRDQIANIENLFETRRGATSLRDVVLSEGKKEASRFVLEEISRVDDLIEASSSSVADASERMKNSVSKRRTQNIKKYFSDSIDRFSAALDVRIGDTRIRLDVPPGGRGSEGPRGMISYYYAFLHTAKMYGSSAYCPIVIDAPNQQGQDKEHIRRIVAFIIENRPPECQVVLGVEDVVELSEGDMDIVDLAGPRHSLLQESSYEEVSNIMRPYLGSIL